MKYIIHSSLQWRWLIWSKLSDRRTVGKRCPSLVSSSFCPITLRMKLHAVTRRTSAERNSWTQLVCTWSYSRAETLFTGRLRSFAALCETLNAVIIFYHLSVCVRGYTPAALSSVYVCVCVWVWVIHTCFMPCTQVVYLNHASIKQRSDEWS